MNLKERYKEVILCSIVLTGLLFWFGVKPFLGRVANLRATIQADEANYAQLSSRLETVQQQAAAIKDEELKKLETLLPKGVNPGDLLVITEAMVANAGLTLNSITPPEVPKTTALTALGEGEGEGAAAATPAPGAKGAKPTSLGGASVTSYQLTVSGSYPDFLKLLNNIAKSNRPISVLSTSITGSEKGLIYNLKLASFYRK
jgi:Tfp pilus assembly protein PilO